MKNHSSLIGRETKLCDIVLSEPVAVTVLNRFGISLGVGDLTVARACDSLGVDKDFIIAILNTYLHENYFPDRILASFRASTIIDYLKQTNHYYEHFLRPNVERHFHLLISKSAPANNNLELMLRFFLEVRQQLLDRIDNDRNHWFPAVLSAEASASSTLETQIEPNADDVDTVEDKLNDLINMIVIHLHGDHDHNLTLAVLLSLSSLKKDIIQNNRIRNRLLRPLHQALSHNL